jgi:hypothetical protein
MTACMSACIRTCVDCPPCPEAPISSITQAQPPNIVARWEAHTNKLTKYVECISDMHWIRCGSLATLMACLTHSTPRRRWSAAASWASGPRPPHHPAQQDTTSQQAWLVQSTAPPAPLAPPLQAPTPSPAPCALPVHTTMSTAANA